MQNCFDVLCACLMQQVHKATFVKVGVGGHWGGGRRAGRPWRHAWTLAHRRGSGGGQGAASCSKSRAPGRLCGGGRAAQVAPHRMRGRRWASACAWQYEGPTTGCQGEHCTPYTRAALDSVALIRLLPVSNGGVSARPGARPVVGTCAATCLHANAAAAVVYTGAAGTWRRVCRVCVPHARTAARPSVTLPPCRAVLLFLPRPGPPLPFCPPLPRPSSPPQAEGVELMHLMLQSRRQCRYGALKVGPGWAEQLCHAFLCFRGAWQSTEAAALLSLPIPLPPGSTCGSPALYPWFCMYGDKPMLRLRVHVCTAVPRLRDHAVRPPLRQAHRPGRPQAAVRAVHGQGQGQGPRRYRGGAEAVRSAAGLRG